MTIRSHLMTTLFAAIGLALVATNVSAQDAAPRGPSPEACASVEAFLAANPRYHLLTIDDMEPENVPLRADEIEPIQEGDVTGDRIRDVVFVVVRADGEKRLYGVVMLRGARRGPPETQWVIRDSPEQAGDLLLSERSLLVYGAPGYEATWDLTWNGSEFEEDYFFPGQRLGVFPDGAPLRSRPRATARGPVTLPDYTEVVVVRRLPKRGAGVRWYRVRTAKPYRGRIRYGYVPANMLSMGNG